MDYKKEVNKIEQFLKTELYREAGRTCGELLESALRDIVSEVKAKAKSGEMLKIIESEKKIGGEGKSHIDLGLGQLVGLFREAKLFDMYEILCNKKLKYSKTIIHLQSLIDLRNTLTHNISYAPSLDELEYFFSNVKTFLNELGLLSTDESASKPIQKIKPDIKCVHCGAEVEPDWQVCPQCQSTLKITCENCGKYLKPTWTVCPQCKTKVMSENIKLRNELCEKGDKFYDKDKFSEALVYYNKAIEIDQKNPGNYLIFGAIGSVYYDMKRFDKSIEYLEKAVSLNSENPTILNRLALAYQSKGLTYKAVEIFKKGIQLFPDFVNFYINLGNIALNSFDLTEAEHWYTKAKKIEPNNEILADNIKVLNDKKHLELEAQKRRKK